MKRLSQLSLAVITVGFVLGSIAYAPLASALSGSDFQPGRIIDDPIFFDPTTMDVSDIQNFLNSKMPACDTNGALQYGSTGMTRAQWAAANGKPLPPYTCLKDYRQDIPNKPADSYCVGNISPSSNAPAAQIIYEVSRACNVNPKVLIVLLQKEQSLVTDDWPWPVQFQKATGYGCPDTASCDPEFAGFFNQVWYAARQFQRYAINPQNYNYRGGVTSYVQYNPNAGCGGTNVFMQNQATAGLYNYTPYQPNQAALNNLYGSGDSCSAYGNRNFWRLFNDWFGSTVASHCFFGSPTPAIAGVTFRKFKPNLDAGNFLIYEGSSTNCIESHTWGVGFGSWQDHTSSNHPIVNPANATVKYADLNGDGKDEPVLIGLQNTGSGMIEFHVWSYSMKQWIVHSISNLPVAATADLSIDFADVNGDGIDDPIAIGFQNTTSGKVEFHYWGPGTKTWQSHIISNLDAPLNPSNMQIRFADLNGDRIDEAIAVGLSSTSTGKVELHVWSPGLWAWQTHIVSIADTINITNSDLQFGDLDGDRIDNGVIIETVGTGSGRIEFHVWNPGMASWQGHYASNQPVL